MKRHRIIWTITGVLALIAAMTFVVREVGEGPHEAADNATTLRRGRLVDAMLDLVDKDPQARRPETKAVVEALATLAERGTAQCAETYYALGVRLRGQRDFEAAETAFRRAIEFDPDWSWPYDGLGYVLYSLGKPEECEANLRKAIALEPSWSRGHNDLSVVLRMQGRFLESAECARRAVELDPRSLAAHNTLGNVLVSLERFDEAAETYQKAIALNPEHPTPYYNIACMKSLEGKPDEAVQFLEKAIAIDSIFREEAADDADFEPIRDTDAFRRLVFEEK
ncbi:MAG TPA: tetratricopeptide repeat protein [Candidatus Hydrogenedentes bacterium]|nr:tetratricopeptide repeat protein [Candidatus Hydrogenedentota bacterium]HIJ74453.1 tetratricopeptide repeat protein [Candidatus Hydrogenedentota bacterium]